MTDKLRFIEATFYHKNNKGNTKALIPIEAIASLEKKIGSNDFSVNFKKGYDFGLAEIVDSISASISNSSIEVLN